MADTSVFLLALPVIATNWKQADYSLTDCRVNRDSAAFLQWNQLIESRNKNTQNNIATCHDTMHFRNRMTDKSGLESYIEVTPFESI